MMAVLALAALTAAEAGFVVRDDIGCARSGVVTASLPFAQGATRTVAGLVVTDTAGAPQPIQASTLVTWPDGSVRWARVELPVKLAAGESKSYRYEVRPGAKPPEPERTATVTESAAEVVIETGATTIRLPRTAALTTGSLGAAGPLPALEIDTPDGRHTWSATPPEEVVVEDRGPLLVSARATGWLKGPGAEPLFQYVLRLTAEAGSPTVRALLTLKLMRGPEVTDVKAIVLRFPAAGAQPAGVALSDGTATGRPLALLPDGDGYRVSGAQAAGGRRPLGAVEWHDGEALRRVAVRHFWQMGPKAVEVDAGELRLFLLDQRREAWPFGRTRAVSQELLLTADPEPALPALARCWEKPLLATVEPAHLCRTEALGMLSPVDRDLFPAFEQAVDAAYRGLVEATDQDPACLGLMHYGDWPLPKGAYGHKGTAYIDQEYDIVHGFCQLYARSGDRRYFDLAEVAARHFMDVDVDQVGGGNRFHGYSENCETHQRCTTGLDWGHVQLDGLVDFHYLTGDRRALEIACGIGENCLRVAEGHGWEPFRNALKSAERALGWPLLSLMRTYEATHDERYRQAADRIVSYLNHYAADPEAELPSGVWWRTWMLDGCKPFMTGLLHEGLDKHHELTGDEATRKSILISLDWLIEHMWNPVTNCFLYEFNAFNPGHRNQFPVELNFLVVHAFGYGYRLTGDRKYLDIGLLGLRAAVEDLLKGVGTGKDYGICFRTSPQVIGALYRGHGTYQWPQPKPLPKAEPLPPAVLAAVPGAAAQAVIAPGAEPAGQAPGLEVRAKAAAVTGRALTSWEEPESWAEWTFQQPATGEVVLSLRYANGGVTAVREAVLDGRKLGDWELPKLGGWGDAPSDWGCFVPADAQGNALRFRLTRGPHTLRLTRRAGGLALDLIAVVPVPDGLSVAVARPNRPPELVLLHQLKLDGDIAPARGRRPSGGEVPALGTPVTDACRGADDQDGFESGLNFGTFRGEPRGIVQFFRVAAPTDAVGVQMEVRGVDPGTPPFAAFLVDGEGLTEQTVAQAKVLARWREVTPATGFRTLAFREAEPRADTFRLSPARRYALVLVHSPDGKLEAGSAGEGVLAGIHLRADRSGTAREPLYWYNGGWKVYPWVVWLAMLSPEQADRPGSLAPGTNLVAGKQGQGVRCDPHYHLAVDVPATFLSRPGKVALWVQPEWTMKGPMSPSQRALFHVQGQRPFAAALSLVTIYKDLRARLYDDHGDLCGALEAPIAEWDRGQWHHVELAWEPGLMTLAVDGQEAARSAAVTLPGGAVSQLFVGWRPGNWHVNAVVDEIELWTAR